MWSDLVAWADQWWDEERGLLWNPPGSFDEYGMKPMSNHMVPQSAWYAVGCMARGDEARATRIFDALRALQYDEPGTIWHGTFARFAEWPQPKEGAIEWIDYDPNWRQFIGTTFRLVELTWGIDLHEPIELAIAGEPRDRVSPRYSNIALMKAWLEADEAFAGEVVDHFRAHGCFEEYNSPTYYGVCLYALALWRLHPPTEQFREWGAELDATLWADIARWYHPGFHNLCGPWSRAYGMDMREYVALLGLWLPEPVVPDLDRPFEHSHDLTMAPVIELLGGGPSEVAFTTGIVSQRITDERVATGWVTDDVMFGGESGGRYRAEGQFHPATAHWRGPSGRGSGEGGGWLRVRSPGPVNAVAAEGVLEVEGADLRVESSGTFPGSLTATAERVVLRWGQ